MTVTCGFIKAETLFKISLKAGAQKTSKNCSYSIQFEPLE